jgi:hypothetical protein
MAIDAAFAREATRLFRRYQVEFVEAFGICPWAAAARREGRVREIPTAWSETEARALEGPHGSEALRGRVLAAIDALDRAREIEIGIVVFPALGASREAFARFVSEVRAADGDARPAGVPFALADFHPDATPVLDPAGAFTSFLRCTPDPTIQLVRRDALDRLRGEGSHGSGFFDPKALDGLELADFLSTPAEPPLHERIALRNRETVEREGLAKIVALFADIRADRDRTYAALASGRPPLG